MKVVSCFISSQEDNCSRTAEMLASRRGPIVFTTRDKCSKLGTRFQKSRAQRSIISGSSTAPENNASSRDEQGGGRSKSPRITAPSSAAPRITGKVGSLSVHAQIKLVEQYRSLSQSSANSCSSKNPKAGFAERTAFRKPKEFDYQQELSRRRKTKQLGEHHVEDASSGTRDATRPTLLVDGYNICGCDEGAAAGLPLQQLFHSGDLYNAQKYLVQELDNLAIHKGYRIVCVFDADRARTSGTDKAEMTESGVWVVFSHRNDADSWIEQASLQELNGICSIENVLNPAKHAKLGYVPQPWNISDGSRIAQPTSPGSPAQPQVRQGDVYVATNDNTLRSVVQCNGAYVISAASLVEDIARARASEEQVLRKLAVSARWQRESHGVLNGFKDPVVTEKLMNMYLTSPTVNVPKFIGRGYGFSSKPRKGKKNKTSKKLRVVDDM